MNELRLFDPFSLDPLDDTLRNILRPWRSDAASMSPRIRIDLSELDGSYVVKAEIPGVRKEDIDVRVDGTMVTISAQVQAEKQEKDNGRLLRQERQQGYSSRTFSLTSPVDEARASASYKDGILELKLPKKAEASTKRLAIQ
jgi:HSP20 family protein